MTTDYEQAVVSLHGFIADWLAGRVDDAAFSRFESALAPEFRIVSGDGDVTQRDRFLAGFRDARDTESADFRIDVRNVRTRPVGDGLAVATFEEHHGGADSSVRVTSALLRADADAPDGVAWLHVHETPLDAP